MGLSLSAEQKDLLKIFKIEEQYVVPAYQRPYSWGYDQCFQLYKDLFDAYKTEEEYFIGNIIIAKSETNKDVLEIIDGQQRLITLLLLIKVLHILLPELMILEQILLHKDWEGNGNLPRIKSDIFEAKDGNVLNEVFKYEKITFDCRLDECKDKQGAIDEKRCNSRFEINILYFYNWLLYYKSKNDDIKDFVQFLLKKVFLLPIELTGKTQDEANEKALVIFETINNRGMNLADADIFKAKLYKKAKNINEEEVFIESWTQFKANCENLNLEIDDVFRYYTHTIRGVEGITSSEINLREFFSRKDYSPFELKSYKEILDDLFKILEILEFINQEKAKKTELAKWLQLIDAYTNQYPKIAVVVYFYVNGFNIDNKIISFLKSLIRYVYYQGSTTTVKFEIYTIIKQICSHQAINDYLKKEIDVKFFDYLGNLKKGLTLLAFYIETTEPLSTYNIDKLINLKDKDYLDNWDSNNMDNLLDCLGNYIVLDIPKKNIPLNKKFEYYQQSKIQGVRDVFLSGFSYSNFIQRDLSLKERLVDFFKGNI